jgi:crotonobetainyl-CoA:carnitine CoA-transferase CaiB-like acyl-CoA transferase
VLHRRDVVAALAERFAGGGRETWIGRLRSARVPVGPVREMHEVVRDPALRERGMVQACTLAGSGGPADLFALPWRTDGARPPLRLPPPALGQHSAEFRSRFG